MEFPTREAAATFLTAKGLKKNYANGGREYWWFIEGTNALLDHSATITRIGGTFWVSLFGRAV